MALCLGGICVFRLSWRWGMGSEAYVTGFHSGLDHHLNNFEEDVTSVSVQSLSTFGRHTSSQPAKQLLLHPVWG
jgi:hypothetical protein